MHDQIGALTELLRTCARVLRRLANESADGVRASFKTSADDLERSADAIDLAAAPAPPDDSESPDAS